jgi:hypothetical protein
MYVDSYLAMAEQEADTAKMDAKVDMTTIERQSTVDTRAVIAERRPHRGHMHDAKMEPNAVLSIIIDCADAQEYACSKPMGRTQCTYQIHCAILIIKAI